MISLIKLIEPLNGGVRVVLRKALKKDGMVELLISLFDAESILPKPKRYADLKKETGLSDGTLSRRLNELEDLKMIKLVPKRDPLGRNFIEYELTLDGLAWAGAVWVALEMEKLYTKGAYKDTEEMLREHIKKFHQRILS